MKRSLGEDMSAGAKVFGGLGAVGGALQGMAPAIAHGVEELPHSASKLALIKYLLKNAGRGALTGSAIGGLGGAVPGAAIGGLSHLLKDE